MTGPTLPDGYRAALALTFDVDGDSPLHWAPDRDPAPDLSEISEWAYGTGVGLTRILEGLHRRQLRGTFYVPGVVVESATSAIAKLLEEGHHVGLHGYRHADPRRLDLASQSQEIERGVEAFELLSHRPTAYRAPFFGLTDHSFGVLQRSGFEIDSSLMDADDPYRRNDLIEVPVHWSVDDGIYLAWDPVFGHGAIDYTTWIGNWQALVDAACERRGVVTLVMHPHWTGRPGALDALLRWLDGIAQRGDVWITAHDKVAEAFRRPK